MAMKRPSALRKPAASILKKPKQEEEPTDEPEEDEPEEEQLEEEDPKEEEGEDEEKSKRNKKLTKKGFGGSPSVHPGSKQAESHRLRV